ncbi:protein rolling stone-like [Patiria miniata]|uniref:Rolling stone n=1 Tax=Patiria miniata TaxID=46514 RepID=A0A914A7J2_PATMI|nr:protein rolling stone-like [Patiria miniata]
MNCCERPKLSDLKLTCRDPSVFHRTQWSKLPAVVFIAYRVVLALYILGFYIALVVEGQSNGGYNLIFLTNVAFIVFVVYLLVSGLVAVTDGCILRKRNNEEMGIRHVIHWLLFNVTINANFIISIIYWAVLYNSARSGFFYNFHVHAVTSIVSMIDLIVTAIPVRLFHGIYPVVFLCTYTVVTLIYWATGNGTVYPFLDYDNNPGLAAGAIVGIFVAVWAMQGFMWAIYKLRMWFWIKCEGQDSILQPDQEQDRHEEGL